MNMRRATFWSVLAIAIAVGALTRGQSLFARAVVEDVWGDLRGRSLGNPAIDRRLNKIKERLPADEAGSFAAVPEEILAFADAHPDRLWHYWRWWSNLRDMHEYTSVANSGLPMSEFTPEFRSRAAEFRKIHEFLKEKDPDNGWPLLLAAYSEASEGITLREPFSTKLEVVDEEKAAKAIEYLFEALEKKNLTLYWSELGTEWARLLNYTETVDNAILLHTQDMATPVVNMPIAKNLAERLLVEAERRLETGENNGPTAYEIARALQTMGARTSLGDRIFMNITGGYNVISRSTEEGVEILRKHGRSEEAELLLKRGRRMLRPWILRYSRPDSEVELYRDPEMFEEARRLAEREKSQQNFRSALNNTGILQQLTTPNIYLSPDVYSDFPAREFQIESRMEYWIWQKVCWSILTFISFAILAGTVVFYCVRQLASKRRETCNTPDAWPAGRRIACGAALFGLFAAVPGIAAAWIGNDFTIPFKTNLAWLAFLNLWGFLAAAWGLTWWVGRSTGGNGENDVPPAKKKGPIKKSFRQRLQRLPTVVLFVSPAFALYFLRDAKQGGELLWRLTEILALIFFVYFALSAVRYVRNLFVKKRAAASALPVRLFMACWAGGCILWAASYCVIDWQERAWIARDTLLIPDANDLGFPESRTTARLVRLLADDMRKALAETAAD